MTELELISDRLFDLIDVLKKCALHLEQIAEALDDPAAVPVYQVANTAWVVTE